MVCELGNDQAGSSADRAENVVRISSFPGHGVPASGVAGGPGLGAGAARDAVAVVTGEVCG